MRGGDAPRSTSESELHGLATRVRPAVGEPRATVVFVHGAMDVGTSFSRVMRRLGDFETAAYDRRGYGDSAGSATDASHRVTRGITEGGALDSHASDLRRIVGSLAQRQPDLPVVVVGHSLGGLIALMAASSGDAPLCDAVLAFEAPLPWTDAGRETSGARTIEHGRSHGDPAAAEFFYRSVMGDQAWERLDATTRERRRAEGGTLLAELVDARRPRVLPLPAGGALLSVAVAERGPSHLHRAAALLARAGGTTVRTVQGAGHGAHLSTPGRYSEWVRDCAELLVAPRDPVAP
ncbi:MAG: alpha/beta fold hydrolase [Microthrixaceae bacterium]